MWEARCAALLRVGAGREPGPAAGAPEPDAELVARARAPAALRRALARVAGRLVATRAWERLGFARLGDYADERAGVSARELRDLAAVDCALGSLRGLEEAFLAGRLGWTQLRLLCRVADPATQQRWLALADALTSAELAREVRVVDGRARDPVAVDPHPEEARVGIVLRLSRRARGQWWGTRLLAQKVAGHTLSHSEFAELLTAEVLSALPEAGEGGEAWARGDREATPSGPAAPPLPAKPPPDPSAAVLPPPTEEVAALGRGLDTADAFELDARLRRGLALESRDLAGLARELARAVVLGIPRELGYRNVDVWAETRLGISRSKARGLLRIERASRSCPPLREAFASGALSWVQAQALLALLLDPAATLHREAWIAHAGRVTVRRLRDDVERALAMGEWAPPALDGSGEFAEPIEDDPAGVQTGAIARLPVEDARLFFTASPEVGHLFRTVLAAVQRRLERIRGRPACTSEALEAMLDHAAAAWQSEVHPSRRREYAIFERDGWRCTAPGCNAYRDLQRHHVVFRSRGGSDDAANLTTLCVWHHLRGVHGGTLRCTGAAPDGLRFELGLRSAAPPLAVYASGDLRCA